MMKYLLLLLVLAVVFHMMGARRSRPPEGRPAAPPPVPPRPTDIVSCAQCGLHLPQDEALPGRGGVFCSAAHRASYEAEHGGGA